jgi:hypothetical protein
MDSRDYWITNIIEKLSSKHLHPLEMANKALVGYPSDNLLLVLAFIAAMVEERPEICLRYIKRYKKHYISLHPVVSFCELSLTKSETTSYTCALTSPMGT